MLAVVDGLKGFPDAITAGHLEKPVHFAWILLLCRLTA
jgi:hypothetical protein